MDRTFLQWPFFEEQHRSVAEHVEQVARDLNVDHSDVDASCRSLVANLGACLLYTSPSPRD